MWVGQPDKRELFEVGHDVFEIFISSDMMQQHFIHATQQNRL
jgi:hypothetical protein